MPRRVHGKIGAQLFWVPFFPKPFPGPRVPGLRERACPDPTQHVASSSTTPQAPRRLAAASPFAQPAADPGREVVTSRRNPSRQPTSRRNPVVCSLREIGHDRGDRGVGRRERRREPGEPADLRRTSPRCRHVSRRPSSRWWPAPTRATAGTGCCARCRRSGSACSRSAGSTCTGTGMPRSIIIRWNSIQPYVSPYGTLSRAITVGTPSRCEVYFTSTSAAILEMLYVGMPGIGRWLSPSGSVSSRGL